MHRDGGRLHLNLLMNHASRWADADSFLPYHGSPDDPRTQVVTGPWIAMPMQDIRYTTIYGSPQAGMLFVNPETRVCTATR